MIIDRNIFPPGHAFVLVIKAGGGRPGCHSLNLMLLLCHHLQAFYGFLLPMWGYSSNGGHQRPGGWVCSFQRSVIQSYWDQMQIENSIL